MFKEAIIAILQNGAFLLAAALIFHVSRIPWREGKVPFYGAHLGIIMGGIGIAIMASAWFLPSGIPIDSRSILMAIDGLFFGLVPVIIAMMIMIVFQIYQHGPGFVFGILVIATSGVIGIIYKYRIRKPLSEISFRQILLFSMVVHAGMLVDAFSLPFQTAVDYLRIAALPVLVFFPVATARLGLLLANRLQQEKVIEKLQEDEENLIKLTKDLRVSERYYRLFSENIKDIVWIFDVDEMRFTYISPSVERVFGYSREEATNSPATVFFQEKDQKRIVELVQNRAVDFREGKISQDYFFTDEFEQYAKDGSRIWTELITSFHKNPENGHIEAHGVTHDITERRNAEDNLRRKEQLYQTLIENAPDGVAIIDLEGKFVFVSPSARKMFGYGNEDTDLINPAEATHPEDLQSVLTVINDVVMDPESAETIQYRFRRKDGSWRWIESTFSNLENSSKQRGIVINFRDITERKQAEDALRESERKFRQIYENTATGISLANSRGQFLSGNPAILKLLGYSEEEYTCLSIDDISHPDDLVKNKILYKELWDGKRNFFSMEKRNISKNGDIVWGQLTCTIVRDKESSPQYAIGMIENIGDRKRAEEKVKTDQAELQRLLLATEQSRRALLSMVEDQKLAEEKIRQLNAELELRVRDRTAQLQNANRELEAFSYSVSHDLRAPLRALDGFSSILVSEYGNVLDEKGHHYLTRIQEASRRMGQLINDLLSLSRVTRTEFIRQNVNLTEVALEVVGEYKSQEPERDIEFVIAPDMLVQGDIQLLKIALGNLISNAVKFSKFRKTAKISIGVEQRDGERFFYVRDNGAGFDMEYARKLFIPFQRLHSTNEFPGTGIGLVIVQRIINRHGGKIWPEARVNKGATFFFTLGDG